MKRFGTSSGFLLSRAGFGIVEVVVAAAMLGFLMMGITSALTNMFKATRAVDDKLEAQSFATEVALYLAGSEGCRRSLGLTYKENNPATHALAGSRNDLGLSGLPSATTPSVRKTYDSIKLGPTTLNVDDKRGNLIFKSYDIIFRQEDPVDGWYVGDIELVLEKTSPGVSLGGKQVRDKFPIRMNIVQNSNGVYEIADCGTLGGQREPYEITCTNMGGWWLKYDDALYNPPRKSRCVLAKDVMLAKDELPASVSKGNPIVTDAISEFGDASSTLELRPNYCYQENADGTTRQHICRSLGGTWRCAFNKSTKQWGMFAKKSGTPPIDYSIISQVCDAGVLLADTQGKEPATFAAVKNPDSVKEGQGINLVMDNPGLGSDAPKIFIKNLMKLQSINECVRVRDFARHNCTQNKAGLGDLGRVGSCFWLGPDFNSFTPFRSLNNAMITAPMGGQNQWNMVWAPTTSEWNGGASIPGLENAADGNRNCKPGCWVTPTQARTLVFQPNGRLAGTIWAPQAEGAMHEGIRCDHVTVDEEQLRAANNTALSDILVQGYAENPLTGTYQIYVRETRTQDYLETDGTIQSSITATLMRTRENDAGAPVLKGCLASMPAGRLEYLDCQSGSFDRVVNRLTTGTFPASPAAITNPGYNRASFAPGACIYVDNPFLTGTEGIWVILREAGVFTLRGDGRLVPDGDRPDWALCDKGVHVKLNE